MEPNVREAAELLLGKKLQDFRVALGSPAGKGDDTVDKGARWSACQEWLRAHSRRALKDYIALIALFGAHAPGEEIEEIARRARRHNWEPLLDSVGSVARSDCNRASNLVASVKAEAREILREQVSRWMRARSAASNEMAKSEELDDRLPLARRGVFDRDLVDAVEDARRENQALSLVMMDIDHFKKIHDAHGHPVGDEVLVEVASLVVERLAHKGRAYRYGGEEIRASAPHLFLRGGLRARGENPERPRRTNALEPQPASHGELRGRIRTRSGAGCEEPSRASRRRSLQSKQGGHNRVQAAGAER